jgi:hypothetical protein
VWIRGGVINLKGPGFTCNSLTSLARKPSLLFVNKTRRQHLNAIDKLVSPGSLGCVDMGRSDKPEVFWLYLQLLD